MRLPSLLPPLLAALILAACGPAAPADSRPADLAPSPTPELPTSTPEPQGYLLDPGLPPALLAHIQPALDQAGLQPVSDPASAMLRISPLDQPGATAHAQWIYALAAPFPTIADDLSWDAFLSYWLNGDASGLAGFASGPALLLAPETLAAMSALIGPVSPALPLQIAASDQLTDLAWQLRPSLLILPFESLEPSLKVISIGGVSPLTRDFDPASYPLVLPLSLTPLTPRGAEAAAGLVELGFWPATNRDPAHLSVVTMTGVTALVRATAMQISLRGYDFPLTDVGPLLRDADILHVSNEVSFNRDCPAPDWVQEGLRFCSGPQFAELLRLAGVDVIDLTGNHILDYGLDPFIRTLDLYESEGWDTFGGGATLDEARRPLIRSLPDGTRVAFLGCNSAGPGFAYATPETGGAAPCDDFAWMIESIQALRAGGEAEIIIVALQYFERDAYDVTAEQRADFEALAAAGADIVSGSQAHQPQGFSFVDGRLVHFGLGNLFFDQMDRTENRQMFIDQHVIYAGRHISTVLYTGLNEDWARPRTMTPEERAEFLATVFGASGW